MANDANVTIVPETPDSGLSASPELDKVMQSLEIVDPASAEAAPEKGAAPDKAASPSKAPTPERDTAATETDADAGDLPEGMPGVDDDAARAAAAAKAPPADSEEEFSADLLSRARDAGFTPEQTKAFGTPGNLETALQAHDRELARIGGHRTEPAGADPPAEPEPAAPAKPPEGAAAPQARTPPQYLTKPYELKSSAEDLGEELHEDLIGIRDSMQAEVNSLRQQMGGSQAYLFEAQIDEYFENLDDKQFGTTPSSLLDEASSESEDREAVLKAFTDLTNGMIASKRPGRMPPLKNLLDRSRRIAFPDKAVAAAQKDIVKKLEKRRPQATHRPTARAPTKAPETAEQRARRRQAEAETKMGIQW